MRLLQAIFFIAFLAMTNIATGNPRNNPPPVIQQPVELHQIFQDIVHQLLPLVSLKGGVRKVTPYLVVAAGSGYILAALTNGNWINWLFWKTIGFTTGAVIGAGAVSTLVNYLISYATTLISSSIAQVDIPYHDQAGPYQMAFMILPLIDPSLIGAISGGLLGVLLIDVQALTIITQALPYLLAYYLYSYLPNNFDNTRYSNEIAELD